MKVITGALALIKVRGIDGELHNIGKMQQIRVTENIRRQGVRGLGELTPSEIPALEWSNNINVSQYAIPLKQGIIYSNDRQFSSVADWVQDMLFNEGIAIHILKKVKDTGGNYTTDVFAILNNCFLTSEGLNIADGQIGGRDATFESKNPILYPSEVTA